MHKIIRIAILMCAAAIMGGCAMNRVHSVTHNAGATGFLDASVQVDGKEYLYSVYVPRDYDSSESWPLIVFLHGKGERGRDGLLQTEVGIGTAIRRKPRRYPAIVVMPQCPTSCWWNGAEDLIDACIAKARKDYTINPKRVYLTGLSMGGFGSWTYGPKHVNEFAAIVPICGGGKTEDAAALAKVPIWAFHGTDDNTVPVEKSREMVEAVKKAGGKIKYTEYPGVGHDSWVKAYAEKKMVQWLFRQTK